MAEPQNVRCSKCNFILYTILRNHLGKPELKMGEMWIAFITGENYELICPECGDVSAQAFPEGVKPSSVERPEIHNDPKRFLYASMLDRTYREIAGAIQTDGIRERAIEYIANVDRIIALAEFPAMSTGLSMFRKVHGDEIRQASFRHRAIDQQLIDAVMSNYRKRKAMRVSPMPPELRDEVLKNGYNELANWTSTHPEISPGIDAVFLAMVTGTWTAFEAMACDLWVAALNTHPKTLAALKGKKDRIEKMAGTGLERRESREEAMEPAQGQMRDGSQLSLNDLGWVSNGSYDASKSMGKLLRRSQKFISLTGIRRAYSAAFSKRHAKIDNLLADKILDTLSVVRHLIVHRAGRADSVYVDEAEGIPGAPKLAEGEFLTLDGQKTKSFIDPVITCGKNLLLAVDEWIVGPAEGTDGN